MPDIRRFARENRSTLLMLLFIAGLYGMLFLSGVSPKEAAPKAADETVLTTAQLKDAEAAAMKRLEEHPELLSALSLGFLALAAASFVVDVWLIICLIRRRRCLPPPAEAIAPLWGIGDVARAFVFLFFCEGVLFIGQALWFHAAAHEPPHDLLLMASSLVRDAAVAFFVLALVRGRGQSARDLGFRTRSLWKDAAAGVVGWVAMVLPMLAAFALLAVTLHHFSYEPLPQNVVQMYLKKDAAPYLFVFTVFVAVIGPALEELFFRGFAYAALRRRFGAVPAMLLTALVFAAFHVNLVAFVPIFLLSLFLTYLYEATGSLAPCITAHVLHNTIMVLMTLGFRSLSVAA